ncbi:hypothetical protein WAI453_009990 [Rhynchosporium graminicola]
MIHEPGFVKVALNLYSILSILNTTTRVALEGRQQFFYPFASSVHRNHNVSDTGNLKCRWGPTRARVF